MEYQVGDIVKTKKQHPCGSKLWEITRVGVDFKLKCQGCGHVIVLERQKALKAIIKDAPTAKRRGGCSDLKNIALGYQDHTDCHK